VVVKDEIGLETKKKYHELFEKVDNKVLQEEGSGVVLMVEMMAEGSGEF
jgi:hypothetical protein